MLISPKNYDEAKKIIKDSVENGYELHKLMVSKVIAVLAIGLGIGAAIGIGVLTQDSLITILAILPFLMVVGPFALPYYLRKRTISRVRSGEYFQDKSEDEIIEIAQIYVDAYNDLEARGKIKSC